MPKTALLFESLSSAALSYRLGREVGQTVLEAAVQGAVLGFGHGCGVWARSRKTCLALSFFPKVEV